jgi:hypothetical protein
MPKPAVLPKPMSEARPLPDDLTGWVKRPADMARRDAVKGAMQHAWSSYEKYAWGSDELCPKTQRGKNLFGPYPRPTRHNPVHPLKAVWSNGHQPARLSSWEMCA